MASKQGTKAKKVVKPTLAEVKGTQGLYLFVDYEGVDQGGFSLKAPRARFAGDLVEEMTIKPFDPQQITDEWLDDPRFKELYERTPGIKVWKSDTLPQRPDMVLPEELSKRLNNVQQEMARMVALSPYNEAMKEVIQAQDRMGSEEQVIRSNHAVILPFLKAIEFYEKRYMNRPEVLSDIRRRLKSILEQKSRFETLEGF